MLASYQIGRVTKCEDVYGGRYARTTNAETAASTAIEVSGAGSSSGYIFTIGDIVRNSRTSENVLVSAVSANAFTAVRAFGTVAAAAMNSGDGLFIVGNANEENASARNVNATRSTPQLNYTLK